MSRFFFISFSRFIALIAIPCLAAAQPYPAKPIRMVVAFPAGGSTDLAARALGEKLSASLGQAIVVENKPGASGNIGAEAVARSAPDGYTLFMAATSFATAPAFFPKLGWDPLKDFAPVSLVATVPIVLVVNPQLPVRTAAELIAHAKANPGKLNIASPGQATLIRLAGEMFKQAAGIEWVTVHYKGGPPAVQDLLSGNAQVMLAQVSDVISLVRAQKLRALAVTSAARSAVAPELPTLSEGPLPGFSVSTWQALVAPAGTPREIIQRLNAQTVKALALPEVKQRFLSFGTDAASSTPEELGRLLADEVSRIGRIAKEVGAKLD